MRTARKRCGSSNGGCESVQHAFFRLIQRKVKLMKRRTRHAARLRGAPEWNRPWIKSDEGVERGIHGHGGFPGEKQVGGERFSAQRSGDVHRGHGVHEMERRGQMAEKVEKDVVEIRPHVAAFKMEARFTQSGDATVNVFHAGGHAHLGVRLQLRQVKEKVGFKRGGGNGQLDAAGQTYRAISGERIDAHVEAAETFGQADCAGHGSA